MLGHKRTAGLALVSESFSFEDGQPVQLEDGSMAYIHHTPKGGPMVLVAGKRELERLGAEHKHHAHLRTPRTSTSLFCHKRAGSRNRLTGLGASP